MVKTHAGAITSALPSEMQDWDLHLIGRVPWSELLTLISFRGTKRDPRRLLRNGVSVLPAVWETQ